MANTTANTDEDFEYDTRSDGIHILDHSAKYKAKFDDYNNMKIAKLVIPDTIDGNKVTSVDKRAFVFINIDEVIIGKNVSRIDNQAFMKCNIKKLTFNTDTSYVNVLMFGGGAFRDNQITSVDFPDVGLTFGDNCFEGNKLTSVVFPATTYSIGRWAFENNDLTSVKFLGDGEDLSVIDEMSFAKNKGLKSVIIPPKVIALDLLAFDKGCIVVADKDVELSYSGFSNKIPTMVKVSDVTKLDSNKLDGLRDDLGFNVFMGRIKKCVEIYGLNSSSVVGDYILKNVVKD